MKLPDQTAVISNKLEDFLTIVSHNEGKEIELHVYNLLSRNTRIVILIPNKKWVNADSLLGIMIRYEEYSSAPERVFRIVAVSPSSPAELAGFIAEEDFLLGSPQTIYSDLSELSTYLELTQGSAIKSLEVALYNAKTKSIRSTLIIPNKNWGGSGLLGCEFGMGYLNVLPKVVVDELQVLLEYTISPEQGLISTNLTCSNGSISKQTSQLDSSLKKGLDMHNIETNHSENISTGLESVELERKNRRSSSIDPKRLTHQKKKAANDALEFYLPIEDLTTREIPHYKEELWQERPRIIFSNRLIRSVDYKSNAEGEENKIDAGKNFESQQSTSEKHSPNQIFSLEEKELAQQISKGIDHEIVEFTFKGIKRFRNQYDPNQRMPFTLAERNTENETILSILSRPKDKQRDRSPSYDEKRLSVIKVVRYTFFSKKLNGEYLIKSTQLFENEKILKLDCE